MLVGAALALATCRDYDIKEDQDPTNNGGSGGSSDGVGAKGGTVARGGTSATGGGVTARGGTGVGGAGGRGGSRAEGGEGGSDFPEHPTDSSQVGIEEFLAAEVYLSNGFRPEATPSDGTLLPHLAVRRYYNQTVIYALADGDWPTDELGSMVVKEILDGTSVIGKAAMLRTDMSWVYYCVSSAADRCFSGSLPNMPFYGVTAGPCSCHENGAIVSFAAIPGP